MSLYDTIAASHRGQCFALLGRRFRLDEVLVADLVYVMLKELSSSLDVALGERQRLIAFLDDLGRGDYLRMLTDTSVFTDQSLRDRGMAIASQIASGRPVDLGPVHDVAELNGIDKDLCRQMLPYVALLMMAAVRHRAERPMRRILAARRGNHAAQLTSDPFGMLAAQLADKPRSVAARPATRLVDALFGRSRPGLVPTIRPVPGE